MIRPDFIRMKEYREERSLRQGGELPYNVCNRVTNFGAPVGVEIEYSAYPGDTGFGKRRTTR
jgi:phage gpG-like protein